MAFDQKLRSLRVVVRPWESLPPWRLRRLGRSLSPTEVTEALRRIEELALEREKIAVDPDLNCDDEDDVHFAQKEIAQALQYLSVRAADALLAGVESPNETVRFWSAYAAKYSGVRAHIPALRAALEREVNSLNKRVLKDAADTLSELPTGPLGSLVRTLRRRREV